MTPKEFKKTYWPDIAASLRGNRAEPALRGRAGRARNWLGEVRHRAQPVRHNRHEGSGAGAVKYVRTFEYFDDDKQGHRFPKVHSITRMPDGRYKYVVDRAFRDYTSVRSV